MLERELEVARTIAREAARILLDIYATDFEVAFKGKDDPVTAADRGANTFLVRALRDQFPGDPVIAEEGGEGEARGGERVWYVDPLDGTKEFIAKNGEFSVMIGLAIAQRAALGVVYQPVTDKLYAGVVGQGATIEQRGVVRSLSVDDAPPVLRAVTSRSHRDPRMGDIAARLGIAGERPSGSVGLKVGLIAEREAEIYVHIAKKVCAWDACGPDALFRAAGGAFTDLFGEPYRYHGESVASTHGLVACAPSVHARVLPVVSEVARAAFA